MLFPVLILRTEPFCFMAICCNWYLHSVCEQSVRYSHHFFHLEGFKLKGEANLYMKNSSLIMKSSPQPAKSVT